MSTVQQQDIDKALLSTQVIPREKFLFWINSTEDLRTIEKLYRITRDGYYRIQPELGSEPTCGLIQSYHLRCIQENVTGDERISNRWEACGSLHIWLRHLLGMGDSSEILHSTAKAVTELFLAGNQEMRDTIETAFLEHALETEALRPFFEHWASDSRLQEAWSRALAWGKAHPDFSWDLLQQIPRE